MTGVGVGEMVLSGMAGLMLGCGLAAVISRVEGPAPTSTIVMFFASSIFIALGVALSTGAL